MKILFLDVDGVLNSGRWLYERNARKESRDDGDERALEDRFNHLVLPVERMDSVDPDAVARLNGLLTRVETKVVVSSTWRLGRSARETFDVLTAFGVEADFFDVTPDIGGRRGRQIDRWLENHKGMVTKFAIVDDDADMEPHHARLVKTTFQDGLLDTHVEQLYHLLKD